MATALATALCAALCTSASADSAQEAVLDARLSALLGQEHAALGAVRKGHAERILTPPQGQGADAAIRYNRVWLLNLPDPDASEELSCLARALYFESRGESVRGQYAVAEVILNRVDSPQYPGSICNVVYQATRGACQFSFTCDGNPEAIHEDDAYALAKRIAKLMKDGAARELTDGATHFHTTGVNPTWARVFPQTAKIGVHLFYRAPLRLSAN